MIEDHCLVAHVVNATSLESAQVELEIASMSANGDWYTNDGQQIWPFWTQAIMMDTPTIPNGWIEHLHAEAVRYATTHDAPKRNLIDLLNLRPKSAPTTPFPRRI